MYVHIYITITCIFVYMLKLAANIPFAINSPTPVSPCNTNTKSTSIPAHGYTYLRSK